MATQKPLPTDKTLTVGQLAARSGVAVTALHVYESKGLIQSYRNAGHWDVRPGKALDRHWRNARTISSRNPLTYKARIVGDWVINGTEPPYDWQIGNGPQAKQGRSNIR